MRVLIVDHQILFREGLSSLLQGQPDIEVVGEAGASAEALSMALELQPDIVLIDFESAVKDGLDAIRAIHSRQRQIGVIVLTHDDSDALMFDALKSGARGFLLKTSGIDVILDSLWAVMRGEVALSRAMMRRFLDRLTSQVGPDEPAQTSLERLSRRELEVFGYVASGASNRQIADRLFISENTVKIHVHNILEKLDLNNRREIAAFAQSHALMR
jgi:DNA-binding NarL/FixJ family response regulator